MIRFYKTIMIVWAVQGHHFEDYLQCFRRAGAQMYETIPTYILDNVKRYLITNHIIRYDHMITA